MRTLSFALTALFLAAFSELATAQPAPEAIERQAGVHFEAARAALAAAHYQPALQELETAAALVPSPVLDYYFGLANEGLGHDDMAMDHFHRYLAAFPAAPERADIEQRLARLDQKRAFAVPPTGQPAPNFGLLPEARPPVAVYFTPPPPPRIHHSRWWLVFPIVGGALLLTTIIVSVALVFAASSTTTSTGNSYEHHWWDLNAAPPSHPQTALFRF